MRPLMILAALSWTSLAGAQLEGGDELEAPKATRRIQVVEIGGRAASQPACDNVLYEAMGVKVDELNGKLRAAAAEKEALLRRIAEVQKEKSSMERLRGLSQSVQEKKSRDLEKSTEEREQLSARLAACEESRAKDSDSSKVESAQAQEDMGTVADAVLKEMQAGVVRADQHGRTFSFSLSHALLFEEGSTKILERGAAVLGKVGRALKSLGAREIVVEGHSDNAPFKKGLLGGYEGHWETSAAQATAVARWLRERAGLDAAHLSSAGFGEFRPVKPNATAEGRAANRRVVIVVAPLTP